MGQESRFCWELGHENDDRFMNATRLMGTPVAGLALLAIRMSDRSKYPDHPTN